MAMVEAARVWRGGRGAAQWAPGGNPRSDRTTGPILLAAVGRTSTETPYFRRFFAAKRRFSEKEIAFFLNIDFLSHVALVRGGWKKGSGQ